MNTFDDPYERNKKDLARTYDLSNYTYGGQYASGTIWLRSKILTDCTISFTRIQVLTTQAGDLHLKARAHYCKRAGRDQAYDLKLSRLLTKLVARLNRRILNPYKLT